ncbi:MAG: hypothetical protein HUJ72_00375, partial [Blautia sp.]|nr:hypothetical protein [Blautia sp.]
MKKHLKQFLSVFLFAAMLFAATTITKASALFTMQASPDYAEKIGNYYYWAQSTGDVYRSATKPSESWSEAKKNSCKIYKLQGSDTDSAGTPTTDGSNIYYMYHPQNSSKVQIKKYSIATRKTTTVGKIKAKYFGTLVGEYNGKLLFENYTGTFLFKSSGIKKLTKQSVVASYGNYYLFVDSKLLYGYTEPLEFSSMTIYNLKSGKSKTFDKKFTGQPYTQGRYFYYAKVLSGDSKLAKVRVYKLDITTGKEKALTKAFKT